MRRVITFLVALAGTLILTLVILIVYLTQVFNPNELKPEIEAQSLARGIPLKIAGDIAWQWYPYLGLNLEQVQLGDEAMLSMEQMSARVALKPLWKRQLRVMSLQLSGVQLNLVRDGQGKGSWQKLVEGQPREDKSQSLSPDKPLQTAGGDDERKVTFGIQRIEFERVTIDYLDQVNNRHIVLADQSVRVDGFELEGGTFHWSQSGNLQITGYSPITISSDGNVTFKRGGKQLSLENFAVELHRIGSGGSETVKVSLTGKVDLDTMSPSLKVKIPIFSLREWYSILGLEKPEMALPEALKSVGLSAAITQSGENWLVEDLILMLDQSRITGKIAVMANGRTAAELKVDRINIDHYLPPVTEQTGINASADAESEPYNFESIRSLQGELQLSIDQLQAKQLQLQRLSTVVSANEGVININELSASFYEGVLSVTGSLDARKPAARLKIEGGAKAVAIRPVLTLLADETRLSGSVNLQGKATMNGDRVEAWLRGISATMEVTAQKLLVETVDVERTACELAALINSKESPQLAWKGATTLKDMASTIEVKGEMIDIRKLVAEVENLSVRAQGRMDLESGEFDLPLDVAFVGSVDPARKCQVRERWRNQPLPLRCKGSMTTLSAKSCLPDRKRLDDLLRDELKGQAKEKIKEKLQKKLGIEGEGALEGLLRGLRN